MRAPRNGEPSFYTIKIPCVLLFYIVNFTYSYSITTHAKIIALCRTIGQSNSYCVSGDFVSAFICFPNLTVFCDCNLYVISTNNHRE